MTSPDRQTRNISGYRVATLESRLDENAIADFLNATMRRTRRSVYVPCPRSGRVTTGKLSLSFRPERGLVRRHALLTR